MGHHDHSGNRLARPGLPGRLLRLVLGLALALWAIVLAGMPDAWTTGTPPSVWAWLGIGAMVWSQESFFDIGLDRRWGHRPQVVWAAGLVLGLGWGAVSGSPGWHPLAGWWVWGTTLAMAAALAFSFLLAAWRAVPG